jgi:hypothetical protein
MDPVSLALTFFLKNPGVATAAMDKALAPGSVEVSKMQESLADLSRGVLFCYHKSARFRSVDFMASPWKRQPQYGADKSLVVRITYQGVGAINTYDMVVAIMAKQNRVRTAVLADSALIPYSKRCVLEDWTGT